MKNFVVYVFIILLSMCVLQVYGQREIFFDHLSVPDGLSSNNINGICQDQYGFLWIATSDGLNRYDGYAFEIYKNDLTDSTTLPHSDVHCVYLDRRGVLWVGTREGLSRYDRDNDRFINFRPTPGSGFTDDQWVVSIFEDSRGRIWLGMRFAGIIQFDRETETFKSQKLRMFDNDGSAFAGPTRAVLETGDGMIFSSASGYGLMRYNESLNVFEVVPGGESFSNNFIWTLHQDKIGKVWIGTSKGLFVYDPKTEKIFQELLKFDDRSFGRLATLHEDEEGNLWIGSSDGIYLYNLRSGQLDHLRQDANNPHSLSNNAIWWSFADEFGVIWFGTLGGGLNKYDPRKIPFSNYTNINQDNTSGSGGSVLKIAPDFSDTRRCWLGTFDGVIYYDRRNGSYRNLELPGDITNKQIGSLLNDGRGSLWIGTWNNGLLKYDLAQGRFGRYTADLYELEGMQGNRVFALEADDYGNIWVGTDVGLSQLDQSSDTFTRIPSVESKNYNPGIIRQIRKVINQNDPVAAILGAGDYANLETPFELTRPETLLVVSVGEGLLNWGMVDYGWLENSRGDTVWSMQELRETFHFSGNFKNRIQTAVLHLPAGSYQLHYISDDSHGYGVWNSPPPADSSWWGIQLLRCSPGEADNIREWVKADLQKPHMQGVVINALEYSRSGVLWVGTESGMSRYDPKSRAIKNYLREPGNLNSISHPVVEHIFEDRDGILWIATAQGLNRFDPRTETFTLYHESDGLPSDQIRAITEDNNGNLWISSMNGLTKFEKNLSGEKPVFINYDVQDGLQGYEFFSASVAKNEDGELFFGGRGGFNSFFPGRINHTPPRVMISGMSISNQTITVGSETGGLEKSILDTRSMVLKHNENDLSFEFATVHFSRPDKNQVYYRLEGYQDEWVNDGRRFASYTNLDPGDYKFRVRGVSSDGVWSQDEAVMAITITPPWYRTTWAFVMYGMFLVVGVFATDRIQRYRLTMRERNRSMIREAELRAQVAESENARKTEELEEARHLQLSLLPERLPELPNLEIAVYMKTATEVGGDYYDFNISADGTLNIALGDATGHGMRAGTVVTLMKGLFSADSGRMGITDFLQQSNDTIKELRFGRVMMAFTLIKLRENRIQMSTAGMPPAYIFRAKTLKVEEICLEGMPLGAMADFPYRLFEDQLNTGDTLLLLSDGLPELRNPDGAQFDYPRVQEIFRDAAGQHPQAIIDRLVDAGEVWRKNELPDDDVTLMVLRAK